MSFHAEPMGRSIHQPCAACRLLRRRCHNKCLLAPYFPTPEVDKFLGVHKVFGASNVIKMIQMVEETKREDTVKAMVYEATARLRDPVYGSAGAIYQLQKMVEELKAEVELMKTRVSEMRQQKDQLLSILDNNAHDYVDPLFTANDDTVFDDYGALSAHFVLPMPSDPFEFPVQGGWVYTNVDDMSTPSC